VMLKDLLRKRQKKKMNSRNSNSTSTTGFSNRAHMRVMNSLQTHVRVVLRVG
jgi:hypothetical protein